MQLALIGLPGAGVKTTFSAITGLAEAAGAYTPSGTQRMATLKVPDPRLEEISRQYSPRKTTPSTVEIVEFPGLFGDKVDARAVGKAREADAVVLVVRGFSSGAVPHPQGSVDAVRDYRVLRAEMLLADLAVVEARLERLQSSLKKRKDPEEQAEKDVLEKAHAQLESEAPLSDLTLTPHEEKRIRGFGFLTRKPSMVIINIGDDQLGQEAAQIEPFAAEGVAARALCGDIESELASMEGAERAEFMADFGISELAAPVVLAAAYEVLETVTFYTYGEDECRAWTVRRGETGVDAAGKIHSDLARGFIRAEVVAFEDFQQTGGIKEAKAAGKFRLEGRDYMVADGDLIIIRHSS